MSRDSTADDPHFSSKRIERLRRRAVRIAFRNRQQAAFNLAADENETVLNAARGLLSIGCKALYGGPPWPRRVRGRLKLLAVDDFPLGSPYNDVARLGSLL
jgi:hypothetical protein